MSAQLCPHCTRPLMSKVAPRCAFCGKPVLEGALSWEDQQQAEIRKHVDELDRAVELNITNDGFDRAGRERAIEELGSLLLPRDVRHDLIERFGKGLMRDFALDLAIAQTVCICGAIATVMLSVEWNRRAEGQSHFNGVSAALLLVGVLSWQKDLVTTTFLTHAASCPTCAKKKPLFERFERFFGPIPKEFQRGTTHVTPLA